MLQDIVKKIYSHVNAKDCDNVSHDILLQKHVHEALKPKLSEYLPYVFVDEEIFINKNSLGFVIETLPLIGANESIEQKLHGLFKSELPLGSNIQFLLIASPKINFLLNKWKEPREAMGGLFETIANRRVKHLRSLAIADREDMNYCARNFKLLISVSMPMRENKSTQFLQIKSLRKKVLSILQNVGMSAQICNAEKLIMNLHEILNPSESLVTPDVKYNQYDCISSQMVDFNTELTVSAEELLWQNQKFRMKIFGVLRFPDEWILSEMGRFIGDFFDADNQVTAPFLLHYGIHICDEKMLKERIITKCSNVEKQANSPIAKWLPSIRREAAEWSYVRTQLENGERVVRSQLTVILCAKNEVFDVNEQKLKGLFESQGWELAAEKYVLLPYFLSCLPMAWGEGAILNNQKFGKIKTTLSQEPVNLLPIQGEWCGTHSPGMLLLGRRGQVFTWDPFDNRSGNYNVAVVGKSGSGKSVFMQEMVVSNLGLGGKSYILDVGRSFEKLVKPFNGTYLEFSLASNICVNPFSAIPIDNPDNMLFMLKPVISLMAAPKTNTNDLENTFIEKAIQQAWLEKNSKANITDVANNLLNMEGELAKDLGKKLYPYTADGDYGRFFNAEANIDLSSNLVVLELEELKERKDLQAVMVQIMILLVTNKIYMSDRKVCSQLVLDESWDMLRNKQSEEFIETAARRLRKYNGSLITGTQSVNDYYASHGAQAAFDNSDWVLLLEQKKSSIQQLKTSKRIGEISTYMEKVLGSLHTRKGKYSEVFINGPDGYTVGRMLLDSFSKLLYTTDAKEFSIINDLTNQGIKLEEVLKRLADAKV